MDSKSPGAKGLPKGSPTKEGMTTEQNSSRVITIIFVSLLLDLLGFTLILPLLPSILDHYSQKDDAVYNTLQNLVDWFRVAVRIPLDSKYNSVLFGGLIGSLFSVLQFLSSPLFGAASDCKGRRPLLLLTTVGVMTSYILWVFSRSFSIFLLSRIVGGICKGNVSLCTAMVADLRNPQARNRGMAMIGVAFSLGFTLGPLLGAYLAKRPKEVEEFYQGPALLALAFSIADLFFIFVMLPETLQKENEVKDINSVVQSPGDLLNPVALFNFTAITRQDHSSSVQNMKNLKVLGMVYFTYLFLFSGLEFTLSFLTHQRFGFSSMEQGKMFFFIGVTMALIQGGWARRIKPGHQIKTVRLALISLIPAFLIIGIAWNMLLLYTGLLLYSFAAAVVVPCLSTQVSEHGSSRQKGVVMGILRSLGALARACGPIVASSVYWLAGGQTCFLIYSVLFVVPLVLLRQLKQSKDD